MQDASLTSESTFETPGQSPGQAQSTLFEHVVDPWASGLHVGIDEVGIGPLAGPVVSAAVLLDPNRPIHELKDSKMLTARKREALAEIIRARALSYALGWASVAEVDQYNVLRASHLAMQRAFAGLSITPRMVLVDGNKTPAFDVPCVAVVQGDKRIPQISAASILAKVARDNAMIELDAEFPEYGFAKHKGYPTKAHMQALNTFGATLHHRRSFAPVARVLGSVGAPAQAKILAQHASKGTGRVS
jgi:ribonuclease HII